ncbi:aldose 1-epimerase [Alicyclobacillus cycloheptanicus]|uniref:Aldose 1-epimerase n=1 Tax=Alicyclobacillus cycloheptanicus TaxID=1457 RepID=A0ABT9XHY8_9BACL|nr:aldose 1-epimerase [Alicyclobacillus cycloheptanicus]MDQ0189393.1 aldose 1-epimerase [Alicyclobacillus cycloheptanicus]WDM02269.1 aldose 1-epimerase [Alicyclobacillus cycloheptanicus]
MKAGQSARALASTYAGIPCVILETDRSQAVYLPTAGGNLIALRDTHRNLHFLHEPVDDEAFGAQYEGGSGAEYGGAPSMERYRAQPFSYGIPVLFPPNRMEDGRFSFEGRDYRLPINELERNNNLHGFLYDQPWTVRDLGSSTDEHGLGASKDIEFSAGKGELMRGGEGIAWLTADFHLQPGTALYEVFPHEFRMSIQYVLGPTTLVQRVEITNLGSTVMPLMLGFHTALRVPFDPRSVAADYRFRIQVGDEWLLNGRGLPETSRSTPVQEALNRGVYPFFQPLDSHFFAPQNNQPHKAELTDLRTGATLTYEVSPAYRTWMVWNHGAKGPFICPEPMTCVVNAPNLHFPPALTGLIGLKPQEKWTAKSTLSWG